MKLNNSILAQHIQHAQPQQQTQEFLSAALEPGAVFWVKLDHWQFFLGTWTGSDLVLRESNPTEAWNNGLFVSSPDWTPNYTKRSVEKTSRSISLETITGGLEYLHQQCLGRVQGGGFFSSGFPQELPINECCHGSPDIAIEFDDKPLDIQTALYREFEAVTGLKFFAKVSSGGKSLHGHLWGSENFTPEQNINLTRLLCIGLGGDPALVTLTQAVRLPGLYRQDKGNYQNLEELNPEAKYSYQEILDGLATWYQHRGWIFPGVLPGEDYVAWLGGILAAYRKQKLTPEDKATKAAEILKAGLSGYLLNKPVPRDPSDFAEQSEAQKRETINDCLNHIPQRIKGAGGYSDYRNLAWAIAHELGDSESLSLMEFHSPSRSCGWNISQVLRSRGSREGGGLGFIINFAKRNGYTPRRESSVVIHSQTTSGQTTPKDKPYSGPVFVLKVGGDEPLEVSFYGAWGWWNDDGIDQALAAAVAGKKVVVPVTLPERAIASLGKHLRLSGCDVWVGGEPIYLWHRRKAYLESQSYTPDLIVDSRYNLPLTLNRDQCLKAGTGTGKTTVIGSACVQWQDDNFALLNPNMPRCKKIVLIGSRIRLGMQTCERISESLAGALEVVVLEETTLLDGNTIYQRKQNPTKMIHQQHQEFTTTLQDPMGAAGFVIDSLGKAAECWATLFTGALVIVDECQGVYEHLHTSSTLKRNRGVIYETLEKLLPVSGCVVLADAMASDVVVDYFAKLTGRSFQKIHNRYQADPSQFIFLQIEDAKGGCTDSSGLMSQLDRALLSGQNVVFCSDSKADCEALDNRLGEIYPTLRIDRSTVSDWEALLSSPNTGEKLVEMGIRLFIYSPTLVSGIDICKTGDYFSQGFAHFVGIIGTQQQVQQMARVRDVKIWTVAVPEYTTIAVPEDRASWNQVEAKQRQLLAELGPMLVRYGANSELFQSALAEALRCRHLEAVAGLELERGYERHNTRACLMDLLRSLGHGVKLEGVYTDENLKEEIKGIKEDIADAWCASRFYAHEISIDEARRILRSDKSTEEQTAAAQRAVMIDRLPGIETTELWNVDLFKLVYYKDRGILARLTNWILIHNPTVAVERHLKAVRAITEGSGWLGDVKPLNTKLGLIEASGMLGLVGKSGVTAESPEIKDIVKFLKKSKIARDLNITVGKSPINTINRILSNTLSVDVVSSKSGKDAKRSYSYSPPVGVDILLNCLSTRILELCPQNGSNLDEASVSGRHIVPTILKNNRDNVPASKLPKLPPVWIDSHPNLTPGFYVPTLPKGATLLEILGHQVRVDVGSGVIKRIPLPRLPQAS